MNAYCLKWHVTTSPAFREILVEPLAPYVDVDLVAWNGRSKLPDGPAIFCQRPPRRAERDVWLPMWDHARRHSQAWWDRLHSGLRVIAFSEAVYQKAVCAGLETLRLTYYKDPNDFKPVDWGRRVMMYWNRTGLVREGKLRALCDDLGVELLLFLSKLDPRIPSEKGYDLPAKIGGTSVESYNDLMPRDKYLALLSRANIFIAPRECEGVGMTFLEAMAQGSAVFANDAPTMNEYIDHGETGWFLQDGGWGEIDLEYLGLSARRDCAEGYRAWRASIPAYAEFVMGA